MKLGEIVDKIEGLQYNSPIYLYRDLGRRQRHMIFFYHTHQVNEDDSLTLRTRRQLLLQTGSKDMPYPKVKVHDMHFRLIPSDAENVYGPKEIPDALRKHGLPTYVPFLDVMYDAAQRAPASRVHDWDNLSRRSFTKIPAFDQILNGTFEDNN